LSHLLGWLVQNRGPGNLATPSMSAAKASGLLPQLRAYINSPTGPKTTHFWGPVANWGFVVAVRGASSLRPF